MHFALVNLIIKKLIKIIINKRENERGFVNYHPCGHTAGVRAKIDTNRDRIHSKDFLLKKLTFLHSRSEEKLVQWWKSLTPEWTMVMLWLWQASLTVSSWTDPPGWTMYETPTLAA